MSWPHPFRGKQKDAVPATQLVAGVEPKPRSLEDTDWFVKTDVWEVPNDYNKAERDGLYRYLDVCSSGSRGSYLSNVQRAVEFMSDPSLPRLEAGERMKFVRDLLEACLEADRWDVNRDLKSLAGNFATAQTEPGWWKATRRLLARVIVHVHQRDCMRQRDSAERLAA